MLQLKLAAFGVSLELTRTEERPPPSGRNNTRHPAIVDTDGAVVRDITRIRKCAPREAERRTA